MNPGAHADAVTDSLVTENERLKAENAELRRVCDGLCEVVASEPLWGRPSTLVLGALLSGGDYLGLARRIHETGKVGFVEGASG